MTSWGTLFFSAVVLVGCSKGEPEKAADNSGTTTPIEHGELHLQLPGEWIVDESFEVDRRTDQGVLARRKTQAFVAAMLYPAGERTPGESLGGYLMRHTGDIYNGKSVDAEYPEPRPGTPRGGVSFVYQRVVVDGNMHVQLYAFDLDSRAQVLSLGAKDRATLDEATRAVTPAVEAASRQPSR